MEMVIVTIALLRLDVMGKIVADMKKIEINGSDINE